MPAPYIFPTSLPGPSTGPITPEERRAVSGVPGGPRQFAVRQRDFLGIQRVEWLFRAAEAATFQTWWETDLLFGGAWFEANWPMPNGFSILTVRRFLDAPQWVAVPGGNWRVSAVTEVRGLSLLPGDAAPGGLSVGWASPLFGGTYAHSNSGTGTWYNGAPVLIYTPTTGPIYAGLIGYTSGTVVWNPVWAPLSGDPAPTTNPVGAGGSILQVSFANIGFPERTSAGLLTLSASVDGVPTIDSVQISVAAGSYNTIAWGPTP